MKKIALVVLCLVFMGVIVWAVDNMTGTSVIKKNWSNGLRLDEGMNIYVVICPTEVENFPAEMTVLLEKKVPAGKVFNGTWIVHGLLIDK